METRNKSKEGRARRTRRLDLLAKKLGEVARARSKNAIGPARFYNLAFSPPSLANADSDMSISKSAATARLRVYSSFFCVVLEVTVQTM